MSLSSMSYWARYSKQNVSLSPTPVRQICFRSCRITPSLFDCGRYFHHQQGGQKQSANIKCLPVGRVNVCVTHTCTLHKTYHPKSFSTENVATTTMNSKGGTNSLSEMLVPNRAQLWKHFLTAMVPMIGFGFMDNLIMLQAGELIDTSIGVTFGLSTLTAAAVGQIFSDMSGVCFGGMVGAVAGSLGLPSARLTPDQQRLGLVRAVGTCGRMIGVLCGCLLGMVSLFFMDLEESQRLRRFKELQPILATITRHTQRALRVASCRIYLLGIDSEGKEALFEVGFQDHQPISRNLKSITAFSNHFNHKECQLDSRNSVAWWRAWFVLFFGQRGVTKSQGPINVQSGDSLSDTFSVSSVCFPSELNHNVANPDGAVYFRCIRIGTGSQSLPPSNSAEPIVSYVARTGQAVMCVRSNTSSEDIHLLKRNLARSSLGLNSSKKQQFVLTSNSPVSHTLLCYPVFDDMDRDRVIGVIELADKQLKENDNDTAHGVFTREDERLVRMLSEHLSLYLALGSYYKHENGHSEELESVEKIGWVCPEQNEYSKQSVPSPLNRGDTPSR